MIAAVTLAWLLLAGGANLAPPTSVRAYLAWFDRNGDGLVDAHEYLSYMMRGFDAMDRDGDGVLRASEMPYSSHRRRAVSRADRRRSLLAAFHRQDLNRDDHLDAMEMAEPPH